MLWVALTLISNCYLMKIQSCNKFYRLFPLLVVSLIFSGSIQGQNQSKADSLLKAIDQAPPDTNKVWLLFDLGELYEENNPELAKNYFNQALKLSEEINYTRGYYIYASDYTYVLNNQGAFDSAIIINQKALSMARQENHPRRIAIILGNIGKSHTYKSEYQKALEYFLEAMGYLETAGDKDLEASFNDILQCLYNFLKQHEKAVEYGEKAVAYFSKDSLGYSYANALMNLSTNYMNLKPRQIEKGLEGHLKVLKIARATDNLRMEASALNNIADCYNELGKAAEAKKYNEKALEMARKMNSVRSIFTSLMRLGYFELRSNRFSKAESFFMEALLLSQDHQMLKQEKECTGALVDLAYARNDYPAVKQFETRLDSLSNVVLNDAIQKALLELETKYETEKKEVRIAALENERRTTYWLAGAVGLIFLLTIALLVYRHRLIRNQKKLAEQQVKQLQQEKQLIATQATLDGETAERTRLARDLHDGLGGMLSVVRLNLKDVKSGGYIAPEEVTRFDKALSMLDDSIRELRRVAHHMMPESLLRYGLKISFTDFCNEIPSAHFHYFGNDQRLESNLEILIYRSVHELVNNALRHAEADNINLQVIQENDRISVTVQDDGRGFDTDTVKKGMGLENVNNRVATYNGKMSIYSSPGKGTEINIEFELNGKS